MYKKYYQVINEEYDNYNNNYSYTITTLETNRPIKELRQQGLFVYDTLKQAKECIERLEYYHLIS